MKATKENIEYILEALHKMSTTENWDEGAAQELVMEAGDMWEDYLKGKVLILDSQY